MGRRRHKPPMWGYGKNARCYWCDIQCTNTFDHGPRGATRDHIMPKSRCWEREATPRVWCCRACNEVKGNLTPLQWSMFRKQYPQWKEFFRMPGVQELRDSFVTELETPESVEPCSGGVL